MQILLINQPYNTLKVHVAQGPKMAVVDVGHAIHSKPVEPIGINAFYLNVRAFIILRSAVEVW